MVRATSTRPGTTSRSSLLLSLQTNRLERCPSCSKGFSRVSGVLRHLNNPRSSCNGLFPSHARDPPPPAPNSAPIPESGGGPSGEGGFNEPYPDAYDDFANGPSGPSEGPPPSVYFDVFPGAAAIYGKGKSFMDKFNDDQFAPLRSANPFYPFASRYEWKLAKFLIGSELSMKSIDEYLKLVDVSIIFYFTIAN